MYSAVVPVFLARTTKRSEVHLTRSFASLGAGVNFSLVYNQLTIFNALYLRVPRMTAPSAFELAAVVVLSPKPWRLGVQPCCLQGRDDPVQRRLVVRRDVAGRVLELHDEPTVDRVPVVGRPDAQVHQSGGQH